MATKAEHQASLKKIQDGGVATKVRILVAQEACPSCRAVAGAYNFDEVPELPIEGCSNPTECNSFYAPVLDRRGP